LDRHVYPCINEFVPNKRQLINGSREAIGAKQMLTGYMAHSLNGDAHLTKALIPDFPVGSRRLTPGAGYLKSLTAENVELVAEKITEVFPKGIKLADGRLVEVDAIVCATGFDVSFVPRFPLIGEYGNLQDIWRDKLPAAYMSCMVPGMPNYFSKLPLGVLFLRLDQTNNSHSIPRSKCTYRSRQRPNHYRTSRQIYFQSDPEMPTRAHNICATDS